MRYTKDFSYEISKLRYIIEKSDAIVIGAGAGMSESAGLNYSGKRFQENFSDFINEYGLTDMYTAGFYNYKSIEEYWAYWSRHIYINRYVYPSAALYSDVKELVKNKDYFVITTNVDHQFQKSGFDKERLFYTQGDYGLFQCSLPCHYNTYDNEDIIKRMISEQKNMRIPSELVPKCPMCGRNMSINLRCDRTFVQDTGWYEAEARYKEFIGTYSEKNILFLELGVGINTPVVIKYPFWKMTFENPNAVYACINLYESGCPKEIETRSICIDMDIGEAINKIKIC